MKYFLLLLLIPCIGKAQFRTDVVYEHHKRLYAKIGGGYMFPNKHESGAMGLVSAGVRTKSFFAGGISAGYFKIPGFDGQVIPVGIDLNFFDMNQKLSPVLNIGACYPFENVEALTARSYFNGGIGFSYMGESRHGGILSVNYSQLSMKHEYLPGFKEDLNQHIVYVAFHILL
ncbi:MAG: hypothetical protein EOO04_36655 [Chitinophagaceae bacterium]|nr:MAG: hypothetical protein EOO04_36655 [Chitinophagaceae bacterium]